MMPKGIKLKNAMKLFIHAPRATTRDHGVGRFVNGAKIAAIARFVSGPAKAVFPTLFVVEIPAIITAPGEIILGKNGGVKMEINVSNAPENISRNSAHNPSI